jgi:hypothetical protein
MSLYALGEFEEPWSLRQFSFAKWNDDDDALIELVSDEFACVEHSA